ncbi:MAG: HDOD domain-containing protein [Planctomycetota bacterium]
MAAQTTITGPAAAGAKTLPPELQRAVGRVTELGSLPEVTTRIVELVENPRATAGQVHEVVRSDPALAARILKLVNSAFYGLPAQIASLERAIVMLGLSALKNLALATSLLRLFKSEDLSAQFKTRDLWRHCVAVAVAARHIAQIGRAVPPDEAFVAGLMHDLGIIVGQQVLPERLAAVIDQCGQEPQNFVACEQRGLGTDHQTIGLTLATKWKFPPALRNAIGYHHEPSSLQPEYQRLATAIYVADTLACDERCGFWLSAAGQTRSDWMFTQLNLPAEELERVRGELPERMAEAVQIFGEN